jgi:heavy metal sensor kinase
LDWSAFDRLAPARLLNPDFPALRIVWGRNGEILHQSGDTSLAQDWNSLDVGALSPDRVRIRSNGRVRLAMQRGPGESTVCVAVDVTPEIDRIQHLSWLLAFSGLAVSALGLAGGAWCLQRTLRPMREMQKTASSIRSDNLNQRLNVASMDTELAEFAQSINAMLDRVEAGFEQQRQFAADASHELRTPLAIVLSSTEHALSRDRSAEAYRTELEKCQRAAERMKSLVDALLTLSRLDASNPTLPMERVQLDQICRDQLELHQEIAAQHQVTFVSSLEPCPMSGHAGILERMVANLLLNGILYNRPGGSVKMTLFKKEGNAILEIADTGIGIPEEEREHLFKRFYRVDKARSRQTGGSGLGLAICDLVVQLHHGTMEVDSQMGVGSTFRVILPELQVVSTGMQAEPRQMPESE